MFQAVDYLHKQNPPIIHRDIKPENILFSQGHLKIADFGWSNLKDKVRMTFCGTPEYLAPEMLMEKGHNEKLDVWTLGVLLYEILVGHPPFTPKGEGMSKQELYEQLKSNIVVDLLHQNAKVVYPPFLSEEAIDLLTHLLVRKPGDRFSCHEALRHPFFKKYGLDIEKDEIEIAEKLKEETIKNINHVISGADRKLKPKVLTESQAMVPNISDIQPDKDSTPKQSSESIQNTSKYIDDTLELSQSVFLTPSQLKDTLVEVAQCVTQDDRHPENKKQELETFVIPDIEQQAPTLGDSGKKSRTETPTNQMKASKSEDLQKSLKDLQAQLAKRDEELLRMSRMYSNEREKVKQLEKEIKEKDLLISQLSIQHQTGSLGNDTVFGRESSPGEAPNTALKEL